MNWTEEQQRVIGARGNTLLVSAIQHTVIVIIFAAVSVSISAGDAIILLGQLSLHGLSDNPGEQPGQLYAYLVRGRTVIIVKMDANGAVHTLSAACIGVQRNESVVTTSHASASGNRHILSALIFSAANHDATSL